MTFVCTLNKSNSCNQTKFLVFNVLNTGVKIRYNKQRIIDIFGSTSLSFLSLVFSSSNTLTNRSETGSDRAFIYIRFSGQG